MDNETKKELIDLTQKLIQFPTENPPGKEKPCIEFIEKWFKKRDMDPTVLNKPHENRPQLTVTIGQGSPNLILNGHIDVVPAGPHSEWKHPPFKGKIENGKIYGRGTCDMKANVALAMVLANDLKHIIEDGKLDGSLTVQIAIGEETGEPGTKKLLEIDDGGDFGVVLEPTSMKTATAEKGLAWYEIVLEGKSSHASRPNEGENPIMNSRILLKKLEEHNEELKKRKHELVGKPHLTVTRFEAGTKENVIPDRAKLTIDRRFLPSENIGEIDDEIENILKDLNEAHGLKTSWKRTKTYEPAETQNDNRLVKTFRKNSKQLAGVSSEPCGTEFSSDFRNFVNDVKIPAITWGPHDPDQAHTIDENVRIDEIKKGWKVLKKSVLDLLSEG